MTYYHINKSTLAIISGPHYVKSTHIKKLTSCGNPDLLNLLDYDLVPEVRATLTETQKLGDLVVYADRVEFPAVDFTQEELDLYLSSIVANRIQQLDYACRSHLDKTVHWSAGPMIYDKGKDNKPKSKAVKEWTEACWAQYYTNKAMLQGGGVWGDAMMVYPDCPYSIQEVMAE